jgi:hypothetical protein
MAILQPPVGNQVQDVRTPTQTLLQAIQGEWLVHTSHLQLDAGERLSRTPDLGLRVDGREPVICQVRWGSHCHQGAEGRLGPQAHRAPIHARQETGKDDTLRGGKGRPALRVAQELPAHGVQLSGSGIDEEAKPQDAIGCFHRGLDLAEIAADRRVFENLCRQGSPVSGGLQEKGDESVEIQRTGTPARRRLRVAAGVVKAQLHLVALGLHPVQADLQLRVGVGHVAEIPQGATVAMACQKAWATAGLAMSLWAPDAPPP